LLEPLGLDADSGAAVGQVIQQIVQAATAPLIEQVNELNGGVQAMAGRTLHSEVGKRFPGIQGDAAKLKQVLDIASENQGRFTTFEEALDFAHRGLGFEVAPAPTPEDPPKPRKVSSTPPTRRGPGGTPQTRNEFRRAVFDSL
jgi:hypothetical protein